MADLVLDIDWDITKAEAKQRKLNRSLDESQRKAGLIKEKIDNLNSALDDEKAKQADLIEQMKEQNKEAGKLAAAIDKVKSGTATPQEVIDLGSLSTAEAKLEEMTKAAQRTNAEYVKSCDAHKKIKSEISKQNYELDKQNNKTAEIGDKILLNSKKQNKFTQAFQKSQKSADRFGKRLKSLIASALFFSVVTKAFTALRNEFGKLITEAGTKTAALVSQLNGSLTVLGRTIYESARPYIEWILQALIKMVNILTQGLAKILGKNVDEMRKLAQQTKKAGDEAKKATAGFDTVQTLGSSQGSTDGGVGTDFSALNDGIDSEIGLLMMALSSAALVLGVILAFTGANIPLGLGLIAIGAVGLASTYAAAWDKLNPKIQNTITSIVAIVSAALLVLGVILAFSGVNIPLGIGLIAAGAAGLATMVAPNWNSLDQKTRDTITGVMAIGGAFFLILGLILILTGAGIPLGIGLILLGAGMLYGAYKLTPGNDFVEKVKNLWSNVKGIVKGAIKWLRENVLDDFFGKQFGETFESLLANISDLCEDIVELFTNLIEGDLEGVGRSFVNILADLVNILIDAVNLVLELTFGSQKKQNLAWANLFGKLFGVDPDEIAKYTVDSWNITDSWRIPHVPKLATGAVLPGGSPMLAWVNDQPKGQPYLEGSVENIAAAFEKYLGGRNFGSQNVNLIAKGPLAPLIRLLALEIQNENERVSVF